MSRRRTAAGACALAVLFLAIVVLAGPRTWPPQPPPGPDPPWTSTGPAPIPVDRVPPRISSHHLGGELPVPAAWTNLSALFFPLGQPGGEPTIGADASGDLYVAGDQSSIWKSADDGATWANVADRETQDRDPYVWVDREAGRVWSASITLPCGDIWWSDNDGESWDSSKTAVCGAGVDHDHPGLATGPRPAGVAASYGRIAYYTYNSVDPVILPGAYVTRSLDGGLTWSNPPDRLFDGECQDGYMGAPAVGPDGIVYIAKPGCDSLWVAVSADGGASWTKTAITGASMAGSAGSPAGAITGDPETFWTNPAAATDADGNAFVAWGGKDGRIHLSRSTDGGGSWTAPAPVSPPWLNGTAFSAMTTLDDGRVAVSYLGTSDAAWAGREAHDAGPGVAWHLFVTFTEDALSDDLRFVTLRSTGEEDPVQRGCVWQAGLAVNQSCRNLRDFISMTESHGRLFVAFTDGCDRCASEASSIGRDLYVARIEGFPGTTP